MPESALVNSDVSHARFLKRVQELYDKHKHVTFTWKTGNKVTATQRNSIHLFCKWVAEACNEKGAYMEVTCKTFKKIGPDAEGEFKTKTISTQWTKESVKEFIWYPIQRAVYPGASSVKDLKVKEHDLAQIFDPIIRHLGSQGISVRFPNKKDLEDEQKRKDMDFTGR